MMFRVHLSGLGGAMQTTSDIIATAKQWLKNFGQAPLSETLYAKQLSPGLKLLVTLEKPLSWRVRMHVLWTGKLPEDLPGDVS